MRETSFSESLHETNCPTGQMIYISIALQFQSSVNMSACQVQALIFERHINLSWFTWGAFTSKFPFCLLLVL